MTNTLDVLLAPGVFPPDSGGPATFAPTIARALTDREHTIRVVTNGNAPDGFDERYSFSVVRIPRGENVPLRYVRQFGTLVSELRSFDPDVALVNAFDLQAVTAARVTGVPVVTKIVGDNAWERARRAGITDDVETFQQRAYGPKIEALKRIRTFQTRAANHVVVPSEYLRNLVVSWGVPRERTTVIYNAVDVDPPTVPREERGDRVVTVGRLVPWKGVDGLIDAIVELDEDGLELHVVGDGPERESLGRYAERRDVRDRIVFHGRVKHERVLDLVANSYLFALNSTYEGLPHVVLEAMACGTPVVASNAGGTPEAVIDGETGVLVEQGNARAFVKATRQLATDESLWTRLRENAFTQLDERFDHDTMVSAYEQTLHDLVAQR